MRQAAARLRTLAEEGTGLEPGKEDGAAPRERSLDAASPLLSCSAGLPVRLPLLREGARALHGVLRAPHPLRLRVVELEREVEGMPQTHERRLLAGADGERRALQDLVGPLHRGR